MGSSARTLLGQFSRNLNCQVFVYILSCYFLISLFDFQITATAMAGRKTQVEFEIFGKVQGVFFRKYTQEKGKSLGLKGWCMNTDNGTVQGIVEGDDERVKEMKKWLQTTGSPKSRITKAQFHNEKEIKSFSFTDFKIRR